MLSIEHRQTCPNFHPIFEAQVASFLTRLQPDGQNECQDSSGEDFQGKLGPNLEVQMERLVRPRSSPYDSEKGSFLRVKVNEADVVRVGGGLKTKICH